MIQFKHENIYLNESDPELEYRRRKDEEKISVAYGQRKLCIMLINFFTLYYQPNNPCKKVCYVGASPGSNIQIAVDLFPELEFHLYDPSPFKIKPSKRVILYNQYFTDEDAKLWSDIPCYFISDIRTADYTKAKDLDDNEEQIQKDMEDQMRWYNIIKPVKAHLKFRLPYTGGNRPLFVKYLDGVLFKQAFAPETSTETRLVPHGPNIMKDWDCLKYQSQMFYHNVVIRETVRYLNPLDESETPIDYPELTNDYDSACEIYTLMLFLQLNKNSINPIDLSREITKKLGKKINLEFLRQNPRYIKEKNMPMRRDNSIKHGKKIIF